MMPNSLKPNARRFCVAPMMDWSDRHCRYLWRLISKHAFLYTEMVTTGALLRGDAPRFLQFNVQETPVALQLGGSDARELAQCARMAEDWGYDEVNLNCGCPSDRVQSGRFGACLMAESDLVAECFVAMQKAVSIPVTIKHRIGIDDQDEEKDLDVFVKTIAEAGCKTFIVHARKAWLQGLSPKENRDIPPLNYQRVYRLKKDYPQLEIIVNGGITTIEQSQTHLREVDGVMIGREAYNNPYLLALVDPHIYGDETIVAPSRSETVKQYAEYCREEISRGSKLSNLSRHLLEMFHAQPGGKQFRRYISEGAHKENADEKVLLEALALVV